MFWSIHATKGGVGTSVLAAAVGLELAKLEPWTTPQGVVLADFCGDQGDILGVDTTGLHGVVDWLASPDPVDVGSLEALLIPVKPGLSLLPRGQTELATCTEIEPQRIAQLVKSLGGQASVIADLGVLSNAPTSPRCLVGAASDRRTLVMAPCYLALRRGSEIPVTFDSVVEVFEDGRALRTLDVEAVIGQPVTARVRVDPAIARAVDSGTLVSRVPRALRRCVGDLIAEHQHAMAESLSGGHRQVAQW